MERESLRSIDDDNKIAREMLTSLWLGAVAHDGVMNLDHAEELARILRVHLTQEPVDTPAAVHSVESLITSLAGLRRILSALVNYDRAPRLADPFAMLDDAVKLVQYLAGKSGVELQIDAPRGPDEFICHDRSMVYAFVSVLINAIESYKGGSGADRPRTVLVSALVHRNVFELRIVDKGKGIPSDGIERAFSPAFTTKVNGHGMGLYISRKIIEKAGGQIELTSTLGVGTAVHIALPFERKKASNPRLQDDAAQAPRA